MENRQILTVFLTLILFSLPLMNIPNVSGVDIKVDRAGLRYTPVTELKAYDGSIETSYFFDGANYIYITPYGNYTWLQPLNILRFTDLNGTVLVDKSVFVLQYLSTSTWLPLLDFNNSLTITTLTDSTFEIQYDVMFKYRGKDRHVADVTITFHADIPKISVIMVKVDWDSYLTDFRWIWDIVPEETWTHWVNRTGSILDITTIDGRIPLQNYTRIKFTNGSLNDYSCILSVKDFGATIFEGGDETFWNSKGFVAVFPVNVSDIDPIAYAQLANGDANFTPANDGVWDNTIDTDDFALGIPKPCVLEILLENNKAGAVRTLGVRELGSGLARILAIHEPEGGGYTHASMLVQTDADGLFEAYSSDVGDSTHHIVGYFTGVTYTEMFNAWQTAGGDIDAFVEKDLFTDYTVPKGRICEVVCENIINAGTSAGVRAKGSALDRKYKLNEAEGGGRCGYSTFVKSDSSDGKIEYYDDGFAASEGSYTLVGYFDSAVDFTERNDTLDTVGDAGWENEALNAYGVPASAIVAILCLNGEFGAENELGVREDGTAIDRKWDEHETEGTPDENSGFRLCVTAGSDTNRTIDIYEEDTSTCVLYHHGWFSDVGVGPEEYERAAAQAINFAFATTRLSEFFRSVTQGISFAFATALSAMEISRFVTQSVGFAFATSRLGEFVRSVSQAVGFAFTTSRLGEFTRAVTQVVSFAFATGRLAEVTRDVIQAIGIAFSTGRLAEFFRSVTQAIGFAFATGRLAEFVRSASQAIGFAFNGERLIEVTKTVTQAINFAFTTSRLAEFTRVASQAIGFAFATSRLTEFTRAVTQAIGFAFETSRLAEFVRTATQAINFAFATALSQLEISRFVTQAIGFAFTTTRLAEFTRAVTQAIGVAFSTTRLAEFIRVVTQAINFAFTTARLSEFIRTASQAINVAFATSKIFEVTVFVTQAIGFAFETVRSLGIWTRTAILEFVVSSEVLWGDLGFGSEWVFAGALIFILVASPLLIIFIVKRRRR